MDFHGVINLLYISADAVGWLVYFLGCVTGTVTYSHADMACCSNFCAFIDLEASIYKLNPEKGVFFKTYTRGTSVCCNMVASSTCIK